MKVKTCTLMKNNNTCNLQLVLVWPSLRSNYPQTYFKDTLNETINKYIVCIFTTPFAIIIRLLLEIPMPNFDQHWPNFLFQYTTTAN